MGALESETIKSILKSMGLPKDAVLIVHSSIRDLSRQGFKAQAIIESLLESIPDGTLLMPTMTWKTVTPENPIFDEMHSPSHTGVLTEIFRTQYATARSLHPTHSVAGLGPQASKLLATHHVDSSPVSPNSPYGLMREYPSYILLLGVGIEVCTAIHLPEEIMAPDLYLLPIEEAESYTLIDRNSKLFSYHLRRHAKAARNTSFFNKILPFLEKGLSYSTIGDTKLQLISMDKLMRVTIQKLSNNPQFFIQG